MTTSTLLTAAPLTGVVGAEVAGIDLAEPTDEQVAELRALLDEHAVLVLHGQRLDPEQQVAFSRRLGPPSPTPFVEPSPDHPEVIKVLKEADEGAAFNFGGAWHCDFSFLPEPPTATVLHALDVPPHGGDTVWADLRAAWDHLPGDLKAEVRDLVAVHTARDAYSPKLQALHDGLRHMSIKTDDSANDVREHPLVTTHDGSGRTVLWCNPAYVRDLLGCAPERAQELLARLHAHCTDVRFTVRHRWQVGDVVIWDNRSVAHIALNDYAGFRRELHRTTVSGPAPHR